MKGRALFLPDISLTACRYLSVLIRAVAGLVWLLPGCESNHTSSSPLSLIYGGKNSLAHLKKFEGAVLKEDGIVKSTFPASALSLLIADILHKIKYIRIQARQWWLFVFSLENSVKGCIIVCPQWMSEWVHLENCQDFTSLKCITLASNMNFSIMLIMEWRWDYCHDHFSSSKCLFINLFSGKSTYSLALFFSDFKDYYVH